MKKTLWHLLLLNIISMALPQAEEVFWWWDDGLISYEEAEEFLLLLDSQDEEGFCSLLESTLNQKCELEKQKKTKRKNQYAYINWKAEIDSLAQIQKQRLQIKSFFNPFVFEARPDSIFTLTYERKKNKAILGHLTYSLLNTGIPLEPMNGYFGHLAIQNHSLSFLFTSNVDFGFQTHFTKKPHQLHLHIYSFQKNFFFLSRYQNKSMYISLWVDLLKKLPLARIRLKTPPQKDELWHWQGELYIHTKDSLSSPLVLPKSVARSTIWSIQNQKFRFSFLELLFSEKINIPIDSNSTLASTGVSLKAFHSKGFFESSWACREMQQKCYKPQFRLHASIKPKKEIELFSKIKLQGNSFSQLNHRPQLLFGFSILPEKNISFKNELIYPEKTSKKPFSWRQSTQIKTSPFWSFLCHFEIQIQKKLNMHLYRTGLSFTLNY
jgi:hypothetical protein